jgi:hypothetical protein
MAQPIWVKNAVNFRDAQRQRRAVACLIVLKFTYIDCIGYWLLVTVNSVK